MTIPTASNYPDQLDNDTNLYEVHDSLRVRLANDYNVGDSSITVFGDTTSFPTTGLITLTEQCSEINLRAISFYYKSRTDTTFDGLEMLSGFTDSVKPKLITNVTQNVMASHHNNIKDALIAIQEFVGVEGTIDTTPLGETMTGRINFLRKLILTPKAWFTQNKTIGLIPLKVDFTDQSFRLGDNTVTFIWDFGDQTTSNISFISNISVTSVVPVDDVNVIVYDLNGGTLQKTYSEPGFYDVSLRVINEFGEDTVKFEKLINARFSAPEEAEINFVPRSSQTSTINPPTIRSSVNTFIDIEVPAGENPSNPGYSYSGEKLDGIGSPIDPIDTYTWSLGDDLLHVNSSEARASYSVGGLYDLVLRTDTEFGSYRITAHEDSISIIERQNLFLWTLSGPTATASEFGIVSETFVTQGNNNYNVTRDESFLTGTNGEEKAKSEFKKNTGFARRGTIFSGERGTAVLFHAEGGSDYSSMASQEAKFVEYNGFDDVYSIDGSITITRPWNWMFLSSGSKAYFLMGPDSSLTPNDNSSYQLMQTLDLTPTFSLSNTTFTSSNYASGSNDLLQNVTSGFDGSGEPLDGRYSTYRSTWKDSNGYFVRNDGVGSFFRIKSFYRTEGVLGDEFQGVKKLPDVAGTTKLEGELVTMTNGIFFFNNSGSISAYNDSSGVWEVGGPSGNSATFRSVQDTSVSGFDGPENTLLAASDGDRIAYLSYDYSSNALIKYNGTDSTFVNIGPRPSGEQWIMGVY